jgi:heme/copper-type cytochrome/quinol oxidase subunit 1
VAREIDAYGARAKVRPPLATVGLTVLTLGVYGVVWYHRVNVELRDYGRAYRDEGLAASNPRHSVLAIVPGILLFLPPIVSLIGFVGRLRRAQRYGQSELASGWLVAVFVLSGIFIPAIPGYVQSGLNELWRRYPAPAADDEVAAAAAGGTEPTDEELASAPPPRLAGTAA